MPAAWVGAATALYGATQSGGGSGNAGNGTTAYIPTNQAGMDQNFQNYYGNYATDINNLQAQTAPAAQQTFQNQFNNPYSNQYLSGANQASQAYGQQAGQAGQAANQSYGAANQLYQSAFDPQSDLYAQQSQQNSDATNASQYARGISQTPYGASLAANSQMNFNNQWENQQLSRQAQGVSAMNSANQSGAQLGQDSASMYNLSGQIPYSAQNSIYGNQNSAISTYNANSQPYLQGLQQLQSNSLGYMNGAQSANNQAFQQQQANQQNMQNSIQSLGNAAGSLNNWNNTQGFNGYQQGSANYDNYVSNANSYGTGDSFTNMSDPAYG